MEAKGSTVSEADPAPHPPASTVPEWGSLVCSPHLLGSLGEGPGLLSDNPHRPAEQSPPVAGRYNSGHSGSMAASIVMRGFCPVSEPP